MVPRVHHDEIVKAAATGATITVLVDLQPKDPFLILGIMRNVAYGVERETPPPRQRRLHVPLPRLPRLA